MQYFTILISFFLPFGLAAQDWHPFPLDMKKEYNMTEDYGSYYTYFVDSIEVIGDAQKLMVGGKYLLEPFDSCSYLVLEPELYTNDSGIGDWFCSETDGVAMYRWAEVNMKYEALKDIYYIEDNDIIYFIKEDTTVLDTINIPLDLELSEKDTFYFQNHSVIEYVEVTCIFEGFGEIVDGLEDNFKVYEFAAFDANDIYYSGYQNQKFVLSENYGLLDFFRFNGFYEPLNLLEMETVGLRDGGTYYGFEPNANVYMDKFQLGNVYKWEFSGYINYGDGSVSGVARDSLIEINDNQLRFIRKIGRETRIWNWDAEKYDTTFFLTEGEYSDYVPLYRFIMQPILNHGYFTQLDGEDVRPQGLWTKKVDDTYYAIHSTGGGAISGATIYEGTCCVSFGFTEGDNNTYYVTSEYSSQTGYHKRRIIDSNFSDITYTLIGFESPDTLIGDASPLATQDIINIQQARLTLYPNPTNEELTFEVPSKFLSADNATVQIFNIQGQLISEQRVLLNDINQLNTSELSTGLYTLFVKTEKGILTGRFVRE